MYVFGMINEKLGLGIVNDNDFLVGWLLILRDFIMILNYIVRF